MQCLQLEFRVLFNRNLPARPKMTITIMIMTETSEIRVSFYIRGRPESAGNSGRLARFPGEWSAISGRLRRERSEIGIGVRVLLFQAL
jgi:hypothetical protein